MTIVFYIKWYINTEYSISIFAPAMAKPSGGDIKMLGVRPCVRPSVTKLVSAITSDFMHRFTQYLTQ